MHGVFREVPKIGDVHLSVMDCVGLLTVDEDVVVNRPPGGHLDNGSTEQLLRSGRTLPLESKPSLQERSIPIADIAVSAKREAYDIAGPGDHDVAAARNGSVVAVLTGYLKHLPVSEPAARLPAFEFKLWQFLQRDLRLLRARESLGNRGVGAGAPDWLVFPASFWNRQCGKEA